jgi:hypothetical protein
MALRRWPYGAFDGGTLRGRVVAGGVPSMRAPNPGDPSTKVTALESTKTFGPREASTARIAS